MEDLDTPRVVAGSADAILRTLEKYGLEWDGEVVLQSERRARYTAALAALAARGLTFECGCSRRELAGLEEQGYPGTCRDRPRRPGPTATRFRIDETQTLEFVDRVQGAVRVPLVAAGDVVVRRRDGLASYQLAVVVDDAEQGVTDIVRGCDLLPSTAWQLALQTALELPAPRYAHVPLLVEPDGSKLSKSRRSVEVGSSGAGHALAAVLELLGCAIPPDLEAAPPASMLAWARSRFTLDSVQNKKTLSAPDLGPAHSLY